MDRGSRLTVIMSSLEIYFGVVKVFDESGNKVGGNNSRKYPFPKHHESPSTRTLCIFVDLEEKDIFPIEPPRQVLKFSVTKSRFAESRDAVGHLEIKILNFTEKFYLMIISRTRKVKQNLTIGQIEWLRSVFECTFWNSPNSDWLEAFSKPF